MNVGLFSIALLCEDRVSRYLDHVRLGDTKAFPVHCTLKGRFKYIGDRRPLIECVDRLAAIADIATTMFKFEGPIFVDERTKWIEHTKQDSKLFELHQSAVKDLKKIALKESSSQIDPKFEGAGFRPHISLDWYFDRRKIVMQPESVHESMVVNVRFSALSLFEYELSSSKPSISIVNTVSLPS